MPTNNATQQAQPAASTSTGPALTATSVVSTGTPSVSASITHNPNKNNQNWVFCIPCSQFTIKKVNNIPKYYKCTGCLRLYMTKQGIVYEAKKVSSNSPSPTAPIGASVGQMAPAAASAATTGTATGNGILTFASYKKPVKEEKRCRKCLREWCEYLDAYFGAKTDQAADCCSPCRRKYYGI